MRAGISGAAFRLERKITGGMDAIVQDVIRRALSDAKIQLGDVDTVITVASDALDGMMVPVRSDMAGALGKRYLNTPSSAGHALMAAAATIEAGDADSVLLVGWGAASKLAEFDSRSHQFDPFYLRPLAPTVATLQAMQSQSLMDQGLALESDINLYVSRMGKKLWETSDPARFCDGAVALVLQRDTKRDGSLIIEHMAATSRAQIPLDGNLDPENWVQDVIAKFGRVQAVSGFIEVCGQSPLIEMRALAALKVACDQEGRVNSQGGSSQGWFGPATPLRNLAALYAAQGKDGSEGGLLVDLAGPPGQHVTGILFRTGESHAA